VKEIPESPDAISIPEHLPDRHHRPRKKGNYHDGKQGFCTDKAANYRKQLAVRRAYHATSVEKIAYDKWNEDSEKPGRQTCKSLCL
jgi:hypothetical protein